MTDTTGADVCAVVVAYRPDPDTLASLVRATASQVGGVVVVDNTPRAEAIDIGAWPGVTAVLSQGGNAGLAAAQNIGLNWASERGYRMVLMLDQDSAPAEGMVQALHHAFTQLSATVRVGAVGPCFFDPREERPAPFVRIAFPLNRKLWCTSPGERPACDFLISSGMLVPLAVIADVGAMDAGLFIDSVDLEWSFRARSKGYVLHGVCAALMHHQLGEARRRLPFGLGAVVVHGPPRLYYMMRNRVRLYRMSHTPPVWVAQDLPRVLVKLFLFGIVVGPRRRNLRYMLRGLLDGVRQRQGVCPLP